MKPLEVEILVAEVGVSKEKDELYHILYDGTVMDENGFSVLGGEAEAIAERLEEAYGENMTLKAALQAAVNALNGDAEEDERLQPDELEAAVLERANKGRAFRRLTRQELETALGDQAS